MSENTVGEQNEFDTIQNASSSLTPIAQSKTPTTIDVTLLGKDDQSLAGPSNQNGSAPQIASTIGLSKNAQKRILKAKRMEELKPIKRQKEKERKKLKREEARAKGLKIPRNKRSQIRPSHTQTVKSKIVIDLGFDCLMTEKEISSICSQLNLSYSANRLSSNPFQSLIFCGQGSINPTKLLSKTEEEDKTSISNEEVSLFESKVGQRMQIKMLGAWQRWQDVILRDKGGLEGLYTGKEDIVGTDQPVCSKDQIVYLTADTETVLDTIKEGEVYVIGGLVDRNRYKNICAEKAKKLGLRTAKLPIDAERLKSSMVMTVNQVMNILLEYNKTNDWEKAFDQHLPQRKIKKDEKSKEEEKKKEQLIEFDSDDLSS